MWYKDLTVCSFGGRDETFRVAIGWLENGKPFTKRETPVKVYEKLCELRKNPWIDYVSCGYHECDLCKKVAADNLNPPSEIFGTLNLSIPHEGKLYHYPELITHYIKNHSYLPPEEFCEAVLNCPLMNSMEYYNQMVDNGGSSLLSYFE